ncbi:hypothetical protein HQ520_06745 [bacterium]|nr:hypothetical protein [bacterium]
MSPIRVECVMKDCAYHNTRPGDSLCNCTHPDKAHHMVEETCPLYRMDWQKSGDQMDAIRRRFGAKRK